MAPANPLKESLIDIKSKNHAKKVIKMIGEEKLARIYLAKSIYSAVNALQGRRDKPKE